MLVLQRSFKISSEKNSLIKSMASSRQGVVAVAMKSSCQIKLFHHSTLRPLAEVNVYSLVSTKLSNCDEIIKQHKTGITESQSGITEWYYGVVSRCGSSVR